MDRHNELSEQTSCDNNKAKDIVSFLNDEFKISSVPIDFFMEKSFKVKDMIMKQYVYETIYFDRVKKFFFDNIKIKNKKNIGTNLNKKYKISLYRYSALFTNKFF